MTDFGTILLLTLLIVGVPLALQFVHRTLSRGAPKPEMTLATIDEEPFDYDVDPLAFSPLAIESLLAEMSQDRGIDPDAAPFGYTLHISELLLPDMHRLTIVLGAVPPLNLGIPDEDEPASYGYGILPYLPCPEDRGHLEVPILKDSPASPRRVREPRRQLPNRALPLGGSLGRPRSGPRR